MEEPTGKPPKCPRSDKGTATEASSTQPSSVSIPRNDDKTTTTTTTPAAITSPKPKPSQQDLHGARQGLLKAIWQATVAPRFQSKPMDMMEGSSGLMSGNAANNGSNNRMMMIGQTNSFYSTTGGSGVDGDGNHAAAAAAAAAYYAGTYSSIAFSETDDNGSVTANTVIDDGSSSYHSGRQGGAGEGGRGSGSGSGITPPNLTPSETKYLQSLLQSDDLDSIRRASVRLSDQEIFPTAPDHDDEDPTGGPSTTTSVGQQQEEDDGGEGGETTATPSNATTTTTATSTTSNGNDDDNCKSGGRKKYRRRNSLVQQQLFELHEKTTVMPSVTLRRMSSAGATNAAADNCVGTIRGPGMALAARRRARYQSKPMQFDSNLELADVDDDDDVVVHDDDDEDNNGADGSMVVTNNHNHNHNHNTGGRTRGVLLDNNNPPVSLKNDQRDQEKPHVINNEIEEEKSSKEIMLAGNTPEASMPPPVEDGLHQHQPMSYNPLKDLNSWIDGNEGFEVDDEGQAVVVSGSTSNPFKILGTSAQDTSCHPHVLSPPLMEGLQSFMPESLQEHHYWLKFSLVRDGPGLLKLLRHCRASNHTILAIETTDGHVFGSFTSHPWRLKTNRSSSSPSSPSKSKDDGSDNSKCFYGSKESFVWKMRRSRNEPCETIMEQILNESKIDVFPFTGRNNKVQLCTMDGITLGCGEIGTDIESDDDPKPKDDPCSEQEPPETSKSLNSNAGDAAASSPSTHYGNAIHIDKYLESGSTSSSETYGNPCLIHRDSRGETFTVANIELWSLTPYQTVQEADQAEMQTLFHQSTSDLNLIEILVGGTSIA